MTSLRTGRLTTIIKECRTFRRVLFMGLACFAVLISGIFGTDKAFAYSTGIDVKVPEQGEIVAYLAKNPTGNIGFDFDGNAVGTAYKADYAVEPSFVSPYCTGTLSDEEQIHALNTLKAIRYIAGLSDNVTIKDEYSRMAQNSCFINAYNNVITHNSTRISVLSDYDNQMGIQGSKESNIARVAWKDNSLKWSLIHGWMSDESGSNLTEVGHRRWILNPSMGMTGFGSIVKGSKTYTAMYAQDDSLPSDIQNVVWPAQNMPISFFNTESPWSISLGGFSGGVNNKTGEKLDYSKLIVVLLRSSGSPSADIKNDDKETWIFYKDNNGVSQGDGEFTVNTDKFGTGDCIIFHPEDIDEFRPGDRYFVYVSQASRTDDGSTGSEVIASYYVNFFDLENYYDLDQPVMESVTLNSENVPSVKWQKDSLAESYNIYRKTANGTWGKIKSKYKGSSYDDSSAGKGIKYYYRVSSIRTVDGISYESPVSKYKTVTVPLGKTTFSSLSSPSKGKNKLKFKKVTKATGYKIYRRAYGSTTWTCIKTLSGTALTNATSGSYITYVNSSSSLKSKKQYEYRIRAYRTYKDNTVYGAYSTVKKVTTK